MLVPQLPRVPHSQTGSVGTDVFLGAIASGAQPLGYHWYFNRPSLTNANNTSTNCHCFTF